VEVEEMQMADQPRETVPERAEELPPAAHPPVRPDQPTPLDDMPVPPLTDPNETKGG
jgi:hypothetical protein